MVFDSAAETNGISLNKLVLSGPDLINSLVGILLRFRLNSIALMTDIEQMFHSFMVREDHRDFLRFFWHRNNNPNEEAVEYRMKVHLFGNTSSPAIATYGLRKTAIVGECKYGTDARDFVENDFYVDDGLKSVPNCEDAIELLHRTRAMLAAANLRLHKIASNNPKVMQAFPPKDQASNLYNLDLHHDVIPIQRSLGVLWDIQADVFTFQIVDEVKPFTRRGVLSITNSLYDPLGIAAPVIIKAKMLLRAMSTSLKRHPLDDWDNPLPEQYREPWEAWCKSLADLGEVKVPRPYVSISLSDANHIEVHAFSDASVEAIAAVSYLKVIQENGDVHVSFVFGKAKLAPPHATTIPRLELCAAVLGTEITDHVIEELAVQPNLVFYYTDSKVVLGYIQNETRRFYIYVTNRVQQIRKSSTPNQWHYVQTNLNPADLATRSIKPIELNNSVWLTGPSFLHGSQLADEPEDHSLSPEPTPADPEVRPEIKSLATGVQKNSNLGTGRFARFSPWNNLFKGVSLLVLAARSHKQSNAQDKARLGVSQETVDHPTTGSVVDARRQAKIAIIHAVQEEVFPQEIHCIKTGKKLRKESTLSKLSPFIDSEGLLRVGGRLDRASLNVDERHPIIIPGSHHIATLLAKHLHNEVKHQGRHFTHGIIRSNGYWIIGGKRLISKIIYQCMTCRKQRGKQVHQKMADLPIERLTPAPPFTYVGLNVFGPWQVATCRTRGGVASNKRWAVLFTCLTIRAIHIELIEAMDTSSFINALRRFLAIRGPVVQMRSDCGTNFVGARNELEAALKEMDKKSIETYLNQEGCEWIFNPPHASHMGGVWERMIGISRKILNTMLSGLKSKYLTHEVLSTLMAEVAAIINNRPLVPVSNDPETPEVLTPATLLTQKPSTLLTTPGQFTSRDLHTSQWRQVQYLANLFWARWRREFLPMLQPRRKWHSESPNLKEGDLVLLRCKEAARNTWPLARVIKVHKSVDGKVRKIELLTAKDGAKHVYTRPVNEVILLRAVDELN